MKLPVPKSGGFPKSMFTCTTIIRRMYAIKNPNSTGGTRKGVISEYVVMGSVQDAPVDQTTNYMTRGANVDAVIYYPNEQEVEPDDQIVWREEDFTYTVIAQRQEAGMGLLWAVYCVRAK